MAIPKKFNYENEADFTQRFITPLLQRLGFSLVINYHGTREFGKDLVFADVDKFGHYRYHGLQAKYLSNIGIGRDVRGLIEDCKLAFENPFRHPHTGSNERIGTFYVVNGGSISDQARESFFNALENPYGGCIRLIDANSLITLDTWGSITRSEEVGGALTGILLELKYNRRIFLEIRRRFEEYKKEGGTWPAGFRLRLNAILTYLQHPRVIGTLSADRVEIYWHDASVVNNALSTLSFDTPIGKDNIVKRMNEILNWQNTIENSAQKIEIAIIDIMQRLEPLIPI